MRVEKELAVNAPVDRVYGLWTDFENFPRFMKHVESVRKTGDDTYHWKARFGPREVAWDARVIGLVPNRSVTWRSTSGAENAGAVNLAAQGNVTLMQVVIEYHASWFEGLVATVSGELSRAVEDDLERFKRLAEGVEDTAGATARMNADKGANVLTGATATGQAPAATAQGTTSQSIGAGNTGAYGPSAARAGSQTSGAAGATPDNAGTRGSLRPADAPSDEGTRGSLRPADAPSDDEGTRGSLRATTTTPDVGGTRGSLRPADEGTRGSLRPASMAPGEEVGSGAAAGSGGAGTDLAGQAGNRAADSMDFSTRSGERTHGSGAPPINQTTGTEPPVPVSGSHHAYGGTDITPTAGATGFSADLSGSTDEAAAGPTARGSRLETGDNDAGGTSRAMDSGSPAGLDSTAGGGTASGTGAAGAAAGAAEAGATGTQDAGAGGAMGPSLYSDEAAGMTAPGETLPAAPSDTGTGSGGPVGETSAPPGGPAAGVGTAGQTTGAIFGGMTGGAARPIDEERGTAGLSGGTGGWGSSTGGAAGTAIGDLEQGSGVGGAATGDVGQEVGLPAVSTPDLNTGNVPTGSAPSLGPGGTGTGTTSTTAPGSIGT